MFSMGHKQCNTKHFVNNIPESLTVLVRWLMISKPRQVLMNAGLSSHTQTIWVCDYPQLNVIGGPAWASIAALWGITWEWQACHSWVSYNWKNKWVCWESHEFIWSSTKILTRIKFWSNNGNIQYALWRCLKIMGNHQIAVKTLQILWLKDKTLSSLGPCCQQV